MDSGLAADIAYHVFAIDVDNGSGNVTFTIDGANSQTINTNVPTALLEPSLHRGKGGRRRVREGRPA